MNRTQFLSLSTVFLLLFAVVYHIWANWGLVTVHANQQTLGKVITSVERQGHVKIETDLPLDTPVTMDVVKVPVAEALETLSVVTESRWRLLYFAAADKGSIKNAELAWTGGQTPDGWKLVSFPMGNLISLAGPDVPALDPRADVWNPKTAAPADIQTFFTEAAQATDASFAFPQDWNPTVKAAPAPGIVDKVVPKLISSAGGVRDQIFLITKNGQRGPRPDTAGDFRPDFDLIASRVQGQINRLPDDARADAQSAFDSEQAFRKSLQGLDPDAMRQAFIQHMQDPNVQQQLAGRMDGQDGRMNHAQRLQHFQNYVNRKLTAMGKM